MSGWGQTDVSQSGGRRRIVAERTVNRRKEGWSAERLALARTRSRQGTQPEGGPSIRWAGLGHYDSGDDSLSRTARRPRNRNATPIP